MLLLVLVFQLAGVYPVGQGVSPPTVLSRVEPEYTEAARAARIQGTVVLETVVGEDGVPKVSKVVRTLGYGLEQSASRALEQWRFRPGMKDGRPVAVTLNIEVNFNLDAGRLQGVLSGRLSSSGSASVIAVATDPNSPATIYASTSLGIYKTTDGGTSWRPSGSMTQITLLAVDPRNPSVVYASNRVASFKSSDSGATWKQLDQVARQIVFDPQNSSTLYIAGARGISKSTDGGNSWTDVLPGSFSTLTIGGNLLILAISDAGQLYSSSDGARSWQFIGSNLRDGDRPVAAPTADVPGRSVTLRSGDPVDPALTAPRLISPIEGAVFSVYPRQTTVRWEPSPNAATYIVEWDYSYGGVWHLEDQKMPDFGFTVRGTEYTFDFVGAQPGRWRVFPVNAAGQRGTPSEWRTFSYR
jgi:TonB family protein